MHSRKIKNGFVVDLSNCCVYNKPQQVYNKSATSERAESN